MRKVIFTESQIKNMLGEDIGAYINDETKEGKIPDNATGYEVFTNNTDKDALNAVTTATNISGKKSRQNRLVARSRYMGESKDYDNDKVDGFGKNQDNDIAIMSQNNGGKMIRNINKRINGNGSQRLNTTQVEISRMEKDKKDNPERFQSNGGKRMLNILKSTETKQKTKLGNTKETNINSVQMEIPDANKGTGKKHDSGSSNIYYYY